MREYGFGLTGAAARRYRCSSIAALNNSCACPAVVRPAKPSLRLWWIGSDKSTVTRATALIGGLAALALALTAFGFALWATGDGSVLGGFGRAAVLAFAGAAIAAAFGGLAVATRSIASRAWLLQGLSVLLAVLSYAVALGLAETA
jgi:hypothetical protein